VVASDFSETVIPMYQTRRCHTPKDQNPEHNTNARTSNLIWIKLFHDDPKAGSCEHGNYSSNFIKDREFLH
jgi:hypothetical protein